MDLGPEYTCGVLTVPETRNDPDSRSIRLAVATVAAVSENPSQDPIVYLDGGPGNTGLVSALNQVASGMNADRDVIFVDQRGTLHSEPHLACPEQDAFYAEVVGMAYAAPVTGEKSDAGHRGMSRPPRRRGQRPGLVQHHRECGRHRGSAYRHGYRGMEPVRGFVRRSPGRHRAPRPPRRHSQRRAGFRASAELQSIPAFWPAFATATGEMYRACADQSPCAAAYPDLENVFTETVARLDSTPLVVSGGAVSGGSTEVIIDGYTLANTVGLMLAGRSGNVCASPGPDLRGCRR